MSAGPHSDLPASSSESRSHPIVIATTSECRGRVAEVQPEDSKFRKVTVRVAHSLHWHSLHWQVSLRLVAVSASDSASADRTGSRLPRQQLEA